MGSLLIGTSGWVHRHWRGIVYPTDLPQSRWLEFSGYVYFNNNAAGAAIEDARTLADLLHGQV